ncbi:hypothetical protein C6P17_01915 [Weissella confusa]|nr:hypothetical protein C6P17_01915 [Weissella confusa]
MYIENFSGLDFQQLGVNEKIYLYALRNKPELFADSDNRTVAKYKKLANSISEVNLNSFFQNALDYTEIFNQEPAVVNIFTYLESMLHGQIPNLS